MDQRAMAEKAQNEADTSDLAVSSPPSLSTPHSRSGHSGVHHHHKFHHHGVSHHHGRSHHPGELQDFPESPLAWLLPVTLPSPTTPMMRILFMTSTTVVAGDITIGFGTIGGPTMSPTLTVGPVSVGGPITLMLKTTAGTIIIKPTNPEGLFIMERALPTTSTGGPPTMAHLATPVSTARPPWPPQRAPPRCTASRSLTSGLSRVSGPRRPHGVVRASCALSHAAAMQPSMAHRRSRDSILTRSRATVHPLAESSSDVHPQDNYSKTSESWADDEQFERYKTNRPPRAHKKVHSMNVCSMLWGKLCHLFDGLREMLRILTESLIFDAFIFLVVCLNIIMLVVQTFAEVEVRGEWFFVAFDSVFLCIYVVEAMLKIFTMGLNYFCDSWNNLDFFIMATAVLEFVLVQLNSRSFKHTVYSQRVFRIFKVFKSLRALRAIRILRRLSFLTSLQEVTGTLVRSMPSITAILILMFTCRRVLAPPTATPSAPHCFPTFSLVIAVLVDNFEMALLRSQEKVMEERAAEVQETMLAESLTELSKEEPEEVISEHTKQKLFIEKKFGTMTENQQKLLFHFLQLAAGVEHYQQKFRSQASVTDEIVDAAFEAGEEDYRK
ncbi:PREDICTED: cation channel sperm-associated protein 1 [Miniopterus natalensis]|uniref:cation channel sperm-associated protein 1 n=1 Tax=Miniopterus natalensis TaxID=291302 RepID=UPI0007A6EF7B|nr:PREDICTED: cation channel sperm-associated protein 1 [Miniopterus natalensis]